MKVEFDKLVEAKTALIEIARPKSVLNILALLKLTESRNIIEHGILYEKKYASEHYLRWPMKSWPR